MASLIDRFLLLCVMVKKQPVDIWFFYLFILTCTVGVRKVLLFSQINGVFNEYTSMYVYISDIFLFCTLATWGILILYNKTIEKSREKLHTMQVINRLLTIRLWLADAINKEKYKKCSTWNKSDEFYILMLSGSLIFWSFLSIFWSENQAISLYRSLRFLELYGLFFYVARRLVPLCLNNYLNWYENVPRGTFFEKWIEDYYIMSKISLYFRAMLVCFVFIMCFDHYLWDIWQGQILFWLVCGFIYGVDQVIMRRTENCSTGNNFEENLNTKKTSNALFAVDFKIVPRGTILCIGFLFVFVIGLGVAQAFLGIVQFIIQHQVGLDWLKESIFNKNITGVAKININHGLFVRAYGLFPHPNILGGFLSFSLITTLLYKKLFHMEQSNSINIKIIPDSVIKYINFLLLIQAIGLLLTFSKSAVIGLILAIIYLRFPCGILKLIFFRMTRWRGCCIIGCSTWNNYKLRILRLFHVEHFKLLYIMVISGSIGLVALFFSRLDLYVFFIKSLKERALYLIMAEQIISSSPIIGIGTGQFVVISKKMFSDLVFWQYQPVHNVFLLIWSDWGVFGLVVFVLFLRSLFYRRR